MDFSFSFCWIRYYALEFCEASLDRLFLREPEQYIWPFLVTEKEVCFQLAMGLEHIHGKKLIHRDIKPENALIRVESNRVLMKWADFGFSKPVNERGSHSISAIRGTEYWYAAEIYRMRMEEGENVANPIRQRGTVKSDVFSEGLVFAYYLLGGNHPYGKLYDIPKNILNDTPVNLNGMFHFLNRILMKN
jgi:serine/threonine protein kinase